MLDGFGLVQNGYGTPKLGADHHGHFFAQHRPCSERGQNDDADDDDNDDDAADGDDDQDDDDEK
eukprot:9280235-Karenia_brevis.AAC.1